MKLYVMRHGHAEAMPDKEGRRHLTPQGREALEKLSQFLGEHHAHVSHVVHSHKLRSLQTAEIIAKGLRPDHQLEETHLLNPDRDIDPLVDQVEHWNDDTLLVGHMPFVSQLVSQLVTNNMNCDLVRFTPGTIVCLERHEHNRWVISWIVRPEMISPSL